MVDSHVPLVGDLACNPGGCLTRNRTSDPLVHRLVHNPQSYTSQGSSLFFNLGFRPCLLKYLISFNSASRLGRLKGLQPQLLLFRLSNSTLFSLRTHTQTHRQEQLYIPSLPEVLTEEETFVPTPPNQNWARSLRIHPF